MAACPPAKISFLTSDLPTNSLGLGNDLLISICALPGLVFRYGYATTRAIHWDNNKFGSLGPMKLM